jgi:hypothetical protein
MSIIAAGWIGTLALVQALTEAAPAALVLFPEEGLLDALPDAAILSRTRFTVTLASRTPDLTAALYRAGAILVLPAGLRGCVGAPPASASGTAS